MAQQKLDELTKAVMMVKLGSQPVENLNESEKVWLVENRIDFLKKNTKEISTDHDSFALHKDKDDIIDHFAQNADPSKNKAHTQWIVKQYKAGNIRQEDAGKINDTLSNFDKYKGKLKEKDLNKYETLKHVNDVIKPHIGTAASNREMKKSWDVETPGHKLKYEDDKIKIYHLSDKEDSKKLYGGGSDNNKTDWCTADTRDKHNMFDQYNKSGKLHVIHEKGTDNVYQYHVNDGQFMDKNDSNISDKDFARLSPSIHKAWEKHPELLD